MHQVGFYYTEQIILIQCSVLRQTAVSKCEGSPTFYGLFASPSAGCC